MSNSVSFRRFATAEASDLTQVTGGSGRLQRVARQFSSARISFGFWMVDNLEERGWKDAPHSLGPQVRSGPYVFGVSSDMGTAPAGSQEVLRGHPQAGEFDRCQGK